MESAFSALILSTTSLNYSSIKKIEGLQLIRKLRSPQKIEKSDSQVRSKLENLMDFVIL
jgi:hypothetical protein